MFHYSQGEEARARHADIVMQADLFRTYFRNPTPVTRKLMLRSNRGAASLCRAVEAVSQCNWDSVARIESKPDSGDVPDASRAALSAIVHTVQGHLPVAQQLIEALDSPSADDEPNPECWSVNTIARAIWTYATGERSPELALPSLVNRLVTLLPGTAQSVRDFLCFSLALAAFGFGIAALGDADTGRRILLAISNDGSRSRSPLFCGIVDAELVGLQAARGDLTSATFWLARTQRFAQKHDCSLLFSRGMEAIERPSILEGGQ